MKTLRDHFARSCWTKVRHPDEMVARREAIIMTQQYRELMTAYPCLCCGGWHVGHDQNNSKESLCYT